MQRVFVLIFARHVVAQCQIRCSISPIFGFPSGYSKARATGIFAHTSLLGPEPIGKHSHRRVFFTTRCRLCLNLLACCMKAVPDMDFGAIAERELAAQLRVGVKFSTL